MSHFYGTMQGDRGQTTQCGTKRSGMTTIATSWAGAVEVVLYHEELSNLDQARVSLIPWKDNGVHHQLFDGPVGIVPRNDDPPENRDRAVINKLRVVLRRVLYCPTMNEDIVTELEKVETANEVKLEIKLVLEFAAENDPEIKETE